MASYDRTLPAIIEEAESLTNALLQAEGELTPELDALMAMNGRELRDKLDSYGYVIDSLKMRQAYSLQRLKEWERVASTCDKALDNIKFRIQNALMQMELPEIHGFEYTFKLQANPPHVVIEDENLIPGEFVTTETKTTTKVDKKSIMDALKSGKSVPGAHAERSVKLVSKVSQRKEIDASKAVEKL